jgi:hypothetical protein
MRTSVMAVSAGLLFAVACAQSPAANAPNQASLPQCSGSELACSNGEPLCAYDDKKACTECRCTPNLQSAALTSSTVEVLAPNMTPPPEPPTFQPPPPAPPR